MQGDPRNDISSLLNPSEGSSTRRTPARAAPATVPTNAATTSRPSAPQTTTAAPEAGHYTWWATLGKVQKCDYCDKRSKEGVLYQCDTPGCSVQICTPCALAKRGERGRIPHYLDPSLGGNVDVNEWAGSRHRHGATDIAESMGVSTRAGVVNTLLASGSFTLSASAPSVPAYIPPVPNPSVPAASRSVRENTQTVPQKRPWEDQGGAEIQAPAPQRNRRVDIGFITSPADGLFQAEPRAVAGTPTERGRARAQQRAHSGYAASGTAASSGVDGASQGRAGWSALLRDIDDWIERAGNRSAQWEQRGQGGYGSPGGYENRGGYGSQSGYRNPGYASRGGYGDRSGGERREYGNRTGDDHRGYGNRGGYGRGDRNDDSGAGTGAGGSTTGVLTDFAPDSGQPTPSPRSNATWTTPGSELSIGHCRVSSPEFESADRHRLFRVLKVYRTIFGGTLTLSDTMRFRGIPDQWEDSLAVSPANNEFRDSRLCDNQHREHQLRNDQPTNNSPTNNKDASASNNVCSSSQIAEFEKYHQLVLKATLQFLDNDITNLPPPPPGYTEYSFRTYPSTTTPGPGPGRYSLPLRRIPPWNPHNELTEDQLRMVKSDRALLDTVRAAWEGGQNTEIYRLRSRHHLGGKGDAELEALQVLWEAVELRKVCCGGWEGAEQTGRWFVRERLRMLAARAVLCMRQGEASGG